MRVIKFIAIRMAEWRVGREDKEVKNNEEY